MTFADGRPFHPWTLGTEVIHPCAADTYAGRIERLGDSRLRIVWDVTGPTKNQLIVSTFSRLAERDRGALVAYRRKTPESWDGAADLGHNNGQRREPTCAGKLSAVELAEVAGDNSVMLLRRRSLARSSAAYSDARRIDETAISALVVETCAPLVARAAGQGVRLDYSPESLIALDLLTSNWSQDPDYAAGPFPLAVARYFGEVVRQNAKGATWGLGHNGHPVVRFGRWRRIDPTIASTTRSTLSASYDLIIHH
jgi:hypothetical protein